MVTTVRLDEKSEHELNRLVNTLNKKKSEIIREAISFYATNIEEAKKERMRRAIGKSKEADFKLYKEFEDILDESL